MIQIQQYRVIVSDKQRFTAGSRVMFRAKVPLGLVHMGKDAPVVSLLNVTEGLH